MSQSARGSQSAALTNVLKLLPVNPAMAETQAREILKVVPGQPNTLLLLAAAEAAQGKLDAAVETLIKLTSQDPQHQSAWRDLGDLYTALGDGPKADAAYMRHVAASVTDRAMVEAAGALYENRLPESETILRAILKAHPTDIGAIRMLAEIAAKLGHVDDAIALLNRALELTPSYEAARTDLEALLQGKTRSPESTLPV